MGITDSSTSNVVALQIVVAAASITLGFATGALVAWVHRSRNRAKIAGARLNRYVPDHSSASHEIATGDAPAADDSDEPPAATTTGRERRRHPRLDFFGTQWIATFSGGALPEPAAFREVRCLDISTGGFSFASSNAPDYRSIVVRFRVGGAPMYLTARIVEYRPYDRAGDLGYRVGCEFTGRFALSDEKALPDGTSDEVSAPASRTALDVSPTLAGLEPSAASLSPALQ